MNLILLLVLLMLLVGGLPSWGYHQYGYAPSGSILVIVIVVLLLSGRL